MGKIIDKVKGKLMKAEGKATDDKVRQAQGSFHDTKGDAKGGLDKVKRGVKNAVGRASAKVNGKVNRMKRKGAAARRTP
jgi:uncharacterized protein YjbJ (UPF0337 family)